MARTNFTFTFTNAQPGSPVTFSYPVYADGSTTVQDGPQLILDANKAVSVWADSDYLIAVSADGNGLHISGTATKAAPSVTVGDGTAPTNPFGSGGSSADPTQFVALYSAAAVDPATWTGWDAVNDVNGAGFPAGWSVSGKNVAVPPGLYAVTMGADINGGTGVVTASITFNLAGGGNATPESSVTAATGFHAVGISATGWVGVPYPVYLSLNGPAAGNVTNAFPWALIVQLAKS